MPMPSMATAMPSLAPAASPPPGPLLSATATRAPSMEPVDTTTERGALMLTLTMATEMPSSDPAVSPPPGPLLSATATRAPSMEPVDTILGRGALTLTMDTATDSVLALLPTPVWPRPTLPGPLRVSTVLSATTTARGLLMPTPTMATVLES